MHLLGRRKIRTQKQIVSAIKDKVTASKCSKINITFDYVWQQQQEKKKKHRSSESSSTRLGNGVRRVIIVDSCLLQIALSVALIMDLLKANECFTRIGFCSF